jgi:hypothetical protein
MLSVSGFRSLFFCSLLCLILWRSGVYGQRASFLVPAGAELKFDPAGGEQARRTNAVLVEIARDVLKNPDKVNIRYALDFEFRIDSNDTEKRSLSVTLRNTVVSGDIFFRSFPLSTVLVPDRLDFAVQLHSPGDSSGGLVFSIEGIEAGLGRKAVILQQMPEFRTGADSIRIQNIGVSFSDSAVTLFMERLREINDYYATAATLDSLLERGESIRVTDEDVLPSLFLYIEEMNKFLRVIDGKTFVDPERLKLYDPRDVLGKIDRLVRLSRSYSMTFEERLAATDTITLAASPGETVHRFTEKILRYIGWSQLVSDRNGRVYSLFLESFYKSPAFPGERQLIFTALSRLYPGRDPVTSAGEISGMIRADFLHTAWLLTREKKYAESIALLENLRRMEENDPFGISVRNRDTLMQQSLDGVFSSFLGIAASAAAANNFSMAELYLSKAGEYREKYNRFPFSDSLYQSVKQQIFDHESDACFWQIVLENYDEAIDCFALLDEKYKPETFSRYQDSLRTILDKYKLERYRDEALRMAVKKDYDRCFLQLGRAGEILAARRFPADPLVDSLKNAVLPSFYSNRIWSSEGLIWTNHLDDALRFIDSLSSLAHSAGFAGDSRLEPVITRYRQMIGLRYCENRKEEYDLLMIRACRDIELHYYRQAGELLDSSIHLAGGRDTCRIDVSAAEDTLGKYRPVIRYYQQMFRADVMIASSKFDSAVADLRDAIALHSGEKLVRFGIGKIPLYDYVQGKNIPALTSAMIRDELRRNDPGEAYRYLELLRIQLPEPGQDEKELMKVVARELAGRDYPVNRTEDPVNAVKQYAESDPWFRVFRKAYTWQWNSLKNQSVNE